MAKGVKTVGEKCTFLHTGYPILKDLSIFGLMTRQQLISHIRAKKSFLCIGLDPDLTKVPKHLLSEADPIFSFNKEIIDATHEYCISFKPNSAFYEAHGVKGFQSLVKTIDYIKTNYPDHFIIADAK